MKRHQSCLVSTLLSTLLSLWRPRVTSSSSKATKLNRNYEFLVWVLKLMFCFFFRKKNGKMTSDFLNDPNQWKKTIEKMQKYSGYREKWSSWQFKYQNSISFQNTNLSLRIAYWTVPTSVIDVGERWATGHIPRDASTRNVHAHFLHKPRILQSPSCGYDRQVLSSTVLHPSIKIWEQCSSSQH